MMTPPARLATTQERVRAGRPQPPAACTCRAARLLAPCARRPSSTTASTTSPVRPRPTAPQKPPSPCTSPRQTPPRRACSPPSACRVEPVTPWSPCGYLTPAPARTRTTLSSWSITTRPSTSSPTRPPWRPEARGSSPAVGTRRPWRLTRTAGACGSRSRSAKSGNRKQHTRKLPEVPDESPPAGSRQPTRPGGRAARSRDRAYDRQRPVGERGLREPQGRSPPCWPPPRRWPSSGAWPQTSRTPRHPSRSPWPTT